MSDSTLDFTDVLAESIEAIERGEMTIQECLEKYPAYAGRLGELLPLMVMLHEAPQVEPGAVFKQQSPERLLAQLPPAAHENVTFLGALRHKWQSSGFAIPILIRRPHRFCNSDRRDRRSLRRGYGRTWRSAVRG